MEYKAIRVIISGGGTGGHIFPAISIADKLMELNPKNEILFVGANHRMEMEKVPAAGYKIEGLNIVGLQRQLKFKNILNNLSVPFKLYSSLRRARQIIKSFKPDLVIGVGGYASAPLLWQASKMNIPCLIQEQNGFAGLANKILSKRVDKICVAYENMERFFPKEKIVLTGNPIRKEFSQRLSDEQREEGIKFYNLDPKRKHLFIVGGSLGSASLNNAVKAWISNNCPGGEDIDIIWQCGKYYKNSVDEFMKEARAKSKDNLSNIHHFDFIQKMDLAYAAADLIITRAGASTVSELCAIAKAVIFVPSPNVAEDHQTHNAMALVRKDAAIMIKDALIKQELMPQALSLLKDEAKLEEMRENIYKSALPDSALHIAQEAYSLIKK